MRHFWILLFSLGLLACQKDGPVVPYGGEVKEPDLSNPAWTVNRILATIEPGESRGYGEFEISRSEYDEIAEFTRTSVVASASTPLQKVEAIVRWVKSNVKYDYADNSAYKVFKSRKAVCQGYANLTAVMLLSQGYYPVRANGYLGTYGGHAWDYAYAGGVWYVMDPTNSSAVYRMDELTSYQKNLIPWALDIVVARTDDYELAFAEKQLSVSSVSSSAERFVAPDAACGVRITNIKLESSLPSSVKTLELNKHYRGISCNNPSQVMNLEAVEVASDNTVLRSHDGCVYDSALKELLLVPGAKKTIEFPALPVAYKNLLFNHKSLTQIRFSAKTLVFEDYAVEECPNVKEIRVSKDATIPERAFVGVAAGCKVVKE